MRLRAAAPPGGVYEGESAIGAAPASGSIDLELEPAGAGGVSRRGRRDRGKADLILLGPGSLYTSILPNLLIPGIREALAASRAPKVLLLNLMTQPGETAASRRSTTSTSLEQHLGRGAVDAVVAHRRLDPRRASRRLPRAGAEPVPLDRAAFEARGLRVVEADLLARGPLIRHDPAKLARPR